MDYLYHYIPILLIILIAMGFGAGALILSAFIGPRRYAKVKMLPYECGNIPVGEAQVRIPIKFYLVALLFLLFDMETMLIIIWALAFRSNPQIAGFQVFAFLAMLFFMFILAAGFLYEWRKGALKWN